MYIYAHGNNIFFPKFSASPVRLQVACGNSNSCTFSWRPPPILYSRGYGNVSNYMYFIECSTKHRDARRDDQTLNVTYSSTIVTLRLQPYRFYNCCIAAVNEAGRGDSSCQPVITHEAGKLHNHSAIV